jgi:hypothetical protein
MARALHFLALLLLAVVAGCATRVDVVVDERRDLSPYRTWDFAPRGRPTVDAPDTDVAGLDASLARLIEERLRESGFERAEGRAEFFVTYRLGLRRRSVVVNQPRATYQLDSYHSQGSFVIEGSDRVTRVYTEIQLAIEATEARGEILWQAELVQRAEDGFGVGLDQAVDAVMDRFPQHQPDEGERTSPRPRPACEDAIATPTPSADPGTGTRAPGSEATPPPDMRCPERGIDSEPPRPPRWRTRPRLPA